MKDIIISPDFFNNPITKELGDKSLKWYIQLCQRADDNGVLQPNTNTFYKYLESIKAAQFVEYDGYSYCVLFWFFPAKESKVPFLLIPQDMADEIIQKNKFFRKASKKRKMSNAVKRAKCLFENSEYYDVVKFVEAFSKDETYGMCDLPYYHEKMKNWAQSIGMERVDWIAQARNFMLNDANRKQLKLNTNTIKDGEQGNKPVWR